MQARLTALCASLVFFAAIAAAAAQGGGVQVQSAWARATPGDAQTAAVYVTLLAKTGDRLVGISTPAAQNAELHTMTMDGNVMKMRQVDAIDLPAGQTVTLKPGGFHVMLTGLTRPLKEGQSFPLTLTFANTGAQQVTVNVQKVGAMGPGNAAGNGTNMPGMNMPMNH